MKSPFHVPVVIVFLCLSSLVGCSDGTHSNLPPHISQRDSLVILNNQPESDKIITLEEDLTYRDSLLIDRVKDIAVSPAGTVFIAGEAWNRREVIRFDRNGNRLETFGGYGTKEGEFLQIDGIQLNGESIMVYDGSAEKITVLDALSGDLREMIPTPAENYRNLSESRLHSVTPVYRFDNGTYLIRIMDDRNPAYYPDRKLIFALIDSSGEMIADSVLIQPEIEYLIGDYTGKPAPFTLERPERSLLAITHDEKLISAHTSEFLIEKYSAQGNLLKTFYTEIDRVPLDKNEIVEDRFSHNRQLLMVHQAAEYPDRWPALYSMISDDMNRIWVSVITSDLDELEWWVIHPDGTHLVFKWPASRRILLVKDGYAYVVEKDEMGYDQVSRYKILESLNEGF